MLDATDEAWRTELASRESNGIIVKLFWSRSTSEVTVAVADAASADYFELVVDDGESALDVFYHPFAHAAAQGLAYRWRWPEAEIVLDPAPFPRRGPDA
jgi:hypothetical protein